LGQDLEGVTHKVYFDIEIHGKLAGMLHLLESSVFLFQFHPDNSVFRVCHFFASVGLWQLFLYYDLECDSRLSVG